MNIIDILSIHFRTGFVEQENIEMRLFHAYHNNISASDLPLKTFLGNYELSFYIIRYLVLLRNIINDIQMNVRKIYRLTKEYASNSNERYLSGYDYFSLFSTQSLLIEEIRYLDNNFSLYDLDMLHPLSVYHVTGFSS